MVIRFFFLLFVASAHVCLLPISWGVLIFALGIQLSHLIILSFTLVLSISLLQTSISQLALFCPFVKNTSMALAHHSASNFPIDSWYLHRLTPWVSCRHCHTAHRACVLCSAPTDEGGSAHRCLRAIGLGTHQMTSVLYEESISILVCRACVFGREICVYNFVAIFNNFAAILSTQWYLARVLYLEMSQPGFVCGSATK